MGRRPTCWGPPLHGILVIDKPLGLGSTRVVARVRRAAQGNRTGHAGTLDPLATGVLICCIGSATRSVEGLMGGTKIYDAEVDCSAFSVTDDAEGPLIPVDVAIPPEEPAVRNALAGLTGTIMQTPPAFSAIKLSGRPAYALARQGQEVAIAPRPVRIDAIDLLGYDWPIARIRVTCGRGTYIRALARQLGTAMGTGGHLRALRRLAVGPYTLAQARQLDALPEVLTAADLLAVPLPPEAGPPGPDR